MLEKDNMLDAEHYRRKTALYYQAVKPRFYKEKQMSRRGENKMYFAEERAFRSGYRRSATDFSDTSTARISGLPVIYW